MAQDPFEEQIATYALGAMEGEDRRQMEAHLRHCSHCQAELKHAQAVVNQLPLSVDPVQPSAKTRQELLARVRADIAPDSASIVPRVAFGTVARRWIPVLAVTMTGILAILVGLMSTSLLSQLGERVAMEAIMHDPRASARPITATQAGRGAEGKLMAIPGDNKAVLIAYGLPPLPADKTYEF